MMTKQKKHAYDLTEEELNANLKEDVYQQIFKKRSPLKKTPIDPAMKVFFVNMSQVAKKKILTYYDHTVQKSLEENLRKRNEGPQQTQATLYIPQEDLEMMAKEASLMVDQLLGQEEVAMAEEVWKFERRKPLVKPDLVKGLPT